MTLKNLERIVLTYETYSPGSIRKSDIFNKKKQKKKINIFFVGFWQKL